MCVLADLGKQLLELVYFCFSEFSQQYILISQIFYLVNINDIQLLDFVSTCDHSLVCEWVMIADVTCCMILMNFKEIDVSDTIQSFIFPRSTIIRLALN